MKRKAKLHTSHLFLPPLSLSNIINNVYPCLVCYQNSFCARKKVFICCNEPTSLGQIRLTILNKVVRYFDQNEDLKITLQT